MDVIIVCHTEFGKVKDKDIVYDKSIKEGVTAGVPNLTEIADRYGAKVTFAVMPEIAGDFPATGCGHEIGLHIHPGWQELDVRGDRFYVGDSYLREHCKISSTSTVLKNYPYPEQLDMIRTGKAHISRVLGVEPKTFVAGHLSVNDDTVRALIESGFTHDCSAVEQKKRLHYDWSKLPRMCMPYCPSRLDYQQKGDLPLLILPISQTLFGASVTPENIPMIGRRWLESCFLEYYRRRLPLFHICLHSPCMTDPYFIDHMDELLRFIAKHDVTFKRASEIKMQTAVETRSDILPYVFGLNANMAISGTDMLISALRKPKRTS